MKTSTQSVDRTSPLPPLTALSILLIGLLYAACTTNSVTMENGQCVRLILKIHEGYVERCRDFDQKAFSLYRFRGILSWGIVSGGLFTQQEVKLFGLAFSVAPC